MKLLSLILAIVAVTVATADPSDARGRRRGGGGGFYGYSAPTYPAPSYVGRGYNSASSYYERDTRRLPFGSSNWWQQMDREQRGGRR